MNRGTSPFLIVYQGGIPGMFHPLRPPREALGRAPTNTLRFLDSTVSRNHAVFEIDPKGVVRLIDQGSLAGTFVNHEPMTPRAPRVLKPGDLLQFGPNVLLKYVEMDEREERSQRELYRRVVCDPLTGLFNRLFFLDQVGTLAERFAIMRRGIMIAVIDLDHFKAVNDSHGHAVGDLVLRGVSNVLREKTRGEDLLARFGGEEFLLAAPMNSLDECVAFAQELRLAVAAWEDRSQGFPLRVTASVGVTFAPPDSPQDPDLMIKSADLCMYRAKKLGRDRVISPREYPPAQLDVTNDMVTVGRFVME